MPRIAILDYEEKIQLGDKTRFDAQKSFVTKDIDEEISEIRIGPGVATPIDVYDEADERKWFLDWIWDAWTWDVDATFNKVYFTENGVEKTATLAVNNYTFDALLTEIATKMTAAGTQTYVVSKNLLNEVTISAPASFGLLNQNKDNMILPLLGFPLNLDPKSTFTGARVECSRRRIVVEVETTDGADPTPTLTAESKVFYVSLYTEQSDYLFSTDQDLIAEEPDIPKWVPKGRSSFLNVHRKAQQNIIDWLDRNGFRDADGNRLDKWSVVDREQVKLWSSYIALKFIFSGIKNSTDDVFDNKKDEYEGLEVMARNRAILDLAFTKEAKDAGVSNKNLTVSSWSGNIGRR